jgi:DNA-binding SARP family transcriptional activator
MDKHPDGDHNRDNSPLIERQIAYSLNRLTAVVNELGRLTETRPSSVIELVLTDLGHAAEFSRDGIEAAHKLRLWRTHYYLLTSELDAASRSFTEAAQQLGRLIDAALDDWEQRFAVASPGAAGQPAPAAGLPGRLRGLLRRGAVQVPQPRTPDGTSPGRREPAPDPSPAQPSLDRPRAYVIADLPPATGAPPPSPELGDADISARILGPLELSVAGTRVRRWSSLKARAVFQYLLLHHGRPVRREVLMELEWPDHSHSSARNNLNVALCSLRNTLDWRGLDVQAILHKEGCYLLNPELTCWTDRSEFLSMIHDAQSARQAGRTQRAVSACHSAVQLYRGPLFEDDLDGEWYLPERRNLKELYLQALEYLGEIYYDSDQLVLAVEFGQQAISVDPCYEAAHRLLMRCFAQQHQQQLVSRQYRLCAAALQDELDVSPTSETVQLFRTLTSAG